MIATLGRLDQLKSSGQIDGLMQSLARFSETLKVISAAREPKITNCKAKVWGPPLVFNRLWEQQRIPEVVSALSEDRRFRFEIERACFALSLQRLCDPGSDLQGSQWVHTVECPGFDQLELQHLYRGTGFLHDIRHDLERELYLGDVKKSLESDYPGPETPALRPIHGFATAISGKPQAAEPTDL